MTIEIPITAEFHRLPASDKLYGISLHCAKSDDVAALKSIIDVFIAVNALLFAENSNTKRFVELVNSITDGLFEHADAEAQTVSPETEDADAALMREAIEYADMSKKERKRRKKEMIETLKNE
jgi:hypothetical protein